jgi:hypothetical protein
MENADHGVGSDRLQPEATRTETLNKEIARLKNLREDVLLLRFHLARKVDIAKEIDQTDRLISETALKTSLEILERVEKNEIPPTGHVAAAASSLMYAVDALVHGARMAAAEDGTGEPPPPITPESLRASLPEQDIAAALGEKPPQKKKRESTIAGEFLKRQTWYTVFFFLLALFIHLAVTSPKFSEYIKIVDVIDVIRVPLSGFFWAMVGSLVWILVRFRRFGANFAFDPSQAKVYWARVFSGSIVSAVLLYFVFGGGSEAWAENWQVNLPLWAFILGYAGRLQVELLRTMVERVQRSLPKVAPTPTGETRTTPSPKRDNETAEDKAANDRKVPTLPDQPKPKEEEPEEQTSEDKK